MLLVRADTLPEGPKLGLRAKDGHYAQLPFKSYGVAQLRSRNGKSFEIGI